MRQAILSSGVVEQTGGVRLMWPLPSQTRLPVSSLHYQQECQKECRLCRPIALSPQVMSPQLKLRRPNIGVVSPQHHGCVAPTSKILRSIYANDRLINMTLL